MVGIWTSLGGISESDTGEGGEDSDSICYFVRNPHAYSWSPSPTLGYVLTCAYNHDNKEK